MVTLHVLKGLLTGEWDDKARRHIAEVDEALNVKPSPRDIRVMYWSAAVGAALSAVVVWFAYYRG